MTRLPRKINQTSGWESFHLLFLSEGFDDEDLFIAICNNLTERLFEIYPFNYNKEHIGIWALFVPPQAAGETAFDLFVDVDHRLKTRRPQRIVDIIDDILVTPLAELMPILGSSIWLDTARKNSRVVCILTNTSEKLAGTQSSFNGIALEEPNHLTGRVWSLLPYIAMSIWPFISGDSIPNLDDPFKAMAAVLARELAIVCGLYYENELAGEEYRAFTEENLPYPNLMSITELQNIIGDIDPLEVKWIDLISLSRISNIIQIPHPQLELEEQYGEIPLTARNAIVLLQHPHNGDNPNEEIYVRQPLHIADPEHYVPPKMLAYMDEPNLIEGGGFYRKNVFRPSVDCLMRYEGYDRGKEWITIPFCKVCRMHMQVSLGGFSNYYPKIVKIRNQPDHCVSRPMESKLAAEFYKFVNSTAAEFSNDDPEYACIGATFRRVEAFFQRRLHWRNWGEPMGPVPATDNLDHPWGVGTFRYPIHLLRYRHMHCYFANRLWRQRRLRLTNYAATGAPGAIVANGFGCFANDFEEDHQDETSRNRYYPLVNTLTVDNLRDIPEGSVFAIRPNRGVYHQSVRYVERIITAAICVQEARREIQDDANLSNSQKQRLLEDTELKPENPDNNVPIHPGIPGHSVIFMGFDSDGDPIVADQYGVEEKLTSGWRSRYKFWIAAQWFDADNIPPLVDT